MKIYTKSTLIDGSHAVLFAGIHNDEYVASAKLILNANENVGQAHLESVHISRKHRRKGYGKELIKAVIAEARLLRETSISLQVHRENDVAQTLYESFGFIEFVCACDTSGLCNYYLELKYKA